MDKIVMTYYSMQHDPNGNPITTRNHKEAVVAYIVWKLYSPKVFMGIGNANVVVMYERSFEERAGEARGEDFMSGDAINKMAIINSLSARELQMIGSDYCEATTCMRELSDYIEPVPEEDPKIYYWQYNDLVSKGSDNVDFYDDDFLSTKQFISFEEGLLGFSFPFPYTGRIGFAVEKVDTPSEISLFDILDNEISENIYRKIYNPINKLLIIEWNDYVTGSIFIKFKKHAR